MIGQKTVSAIIPSAGVGKRMQGKVPGGVGKQFVSLHNKPLISYTLEKFDKSKYVDEIIVVCAAEAISYMKKEVLNPNHFSRIIKIVPGGKERQDSVYEGFKGIEHADIVLVHDGVRPFVRTSRIDQLIEVCSTVGAAVLAVRPKDTVKSQDNEQYIEKTLDRSTLWNIQTPQAFDYGMLKEAYESANRSGFYGTDEAMLVEKIGRRIKLVEGDYENIKITTPDDLNYAEFILANELKQLV
ncbi:2-C-methyl-D-erythritol 4-phosphate cytidylyltransferase [bacterium]|nr:MAG: 2-C-methyl-D-erythritol 4-phosphate cytidylyltransferase [bacterium]